MHIDARSGVTALILAMPWMPIGLGATPEGEDNFSVRLRSRIEATEHPGMHRLVEKAEFWNPARTALIVCDMWDFHHCLNATKRGAEMAPTMDRVLKAARDRGSVIIHAPSDCMDSYKDHPARKRAMETPLAANLPEEIGSWCYKIPTEEKGVYPLDQTDGGEDDDPAEHAEWAVKLKAMGRNPAAPWKGQTDLLTIDPAKDYVTANGEEVWSILEARGIENVVLMGVHLNMCVLGRPFGLRRMASNGQHVVLMRDLTDTMYNPAMPPFVGHFAGTDLMVEHVEKFVCPTITSDQILGGLPFHFRDDARPVVAFVISEDEYDTDVSLPSLAAADLTKDYRPVFILGVGERGDLPGIAMLNKADAVVISVRRRVLPRAQLDTIRAFVASGKPVVAIRTASHAFAPRDNASLVEGHGSWPGFDHEILGGHYQGHHEAGPEVAVTVAAGAEGHPILEGVEVAKLVGHGSLYKVRPLAKTATPLLLGSIPEEEAEPIAWTNTPATGERVAYTSLGQIDDFAEPAFRRMFRNAIAWAVGR